MNPAVREWARLFNEGSYFEAHEALEAEWLRAAEPEKTFLKGLIHAAVALLQYRRGNGHGARVKYGSFRRYVDPYLPGRGGVDVADLLGEMDRFFAPLLALPEGSAPPAPPAAWPVVQIDDEEVSRAPVFEQQFYMILTARDLDETVAFYRDLLEMPQVHSWSGPTGRGSMLRAATGIVEVWSVPPDEQFSPPRGIGMAVQVPDVDSWHARLQEKGAAVPEAPADQPWGQRLFSLTDPNGVLVIFFSPVV